MFFISRHMNDDMHMNLVGQWGYESSGTVGGTNLVGQWGYESSGTVGVRI